jgi:ABC-type uncharacterized transport system permease subunit
MDRLLLALSSLAFLIGCVMTGLALGKQRFRTEKAIYGCILAGFLALTGFLYFRGEMIGRCPLSNLSEVLIFLSWASVGFYFAAGSVFRLSLLGAFTSPLAFVLLGAAMLFPGAWTAQPMLGDGSRFWPELHAAVSIIAYGAFAIAGLAGVMLMQQERLLKQRKLARAWMQFPAITELSEAIHRLVQIGFWLLTVGLFAGFQMGNLGAHTLTIGWAVGVWILYAGILIAVHQRKLSGKKIAHLATAAFIIALTALWGLGAITGKLHQ